MKVVLGGAFGNLEVKICWVVVGETDGNRPLGRLRCWWELSIYQNFKWAQCHLQALAATGLPSFQNTFSYLTVNKLLHPKRLECSFCLLFIIKHPLTDKGAGDVDIHPGHPSMNETQFDLRNMKFSVWLWSSPAPTVIEVECFPNTCTNFSCPFSTIT